MATITLRQDIECSLQDAFRAATDIKNYPAWNPVTPEVTWISDGDIDVGTQMVVKIPKMGSQKMEVTAFRTNESASFFMVSNILVGGHTWDFSEHDGKTRIHHTAVISMKGFGRLLTPFFPIIKMMFGRNLKIETTASQEYFDKQSHHHASDRT